MNTDLFDDAGRRRHVASVGELAASIVHEVHQPLAAIALHAQAGLRCLEDEASTASARAALCAVLEASTRASAILRAMRTLAQATPPASVPCRLDEIIDAVLAPLAGRLRRQRIGVRLQLAPEPHSVMADPVQLHQVLHNLIDNAIGAMREPCRHRHELVIASRADGEALVVTVADSGCGLPPGQAARLFAPLFTTKENGMGMGLAICRAIVEAHGGSIWAEPGACGGSVFGFRLRHGAQVSSA